VVSAVVIVVAGRLKLKHHAAEAGGVRQDA